MLITPPALTTSFYCSFLISHFFSSLRPSFSLVSLFSLSHALLFPCSAVAWRDATACNGLKGLHSNNRETNCRALLARVIVSYGDQVGLGCDLAARDQQQPALVYHRSFCYGDVPLFSPRFRDSPLHRSARFMLGADKPCMSASEYVKRTTRCARGYQSDLITRLHAIGCIACNVDGSVTLATLRFAVQYPAIEARVSE